MTNRRVEPTGVPSDGDGAPEAVLQQVTRTLDDHGVLDVDLPLYEVVDSSAICELHRHARRVAGSTVQIGFEYDGHEVVVEVGPDVRVAVD